MYVHIVIDSVNMFIFCKWTEVEKALRRRSGPISSVAFNWTEAAFTFSVTSSLCDRMEDEQTCALSESQETLSPVDWHNVSLPGTAETLEGEQSSPFPAPSPSRTPQLVLILATPPTPLVWPTGAGVWCCPQALFRLGFPSFIVLVFLELSWILSVLVRDILSSSSSTSYF